jgi:hypothetical protein
VRYPLAICAVLMMLLGEHRWAAFATAWAAVDALDDIAGNLNRIWRDTDKPN